MVAAPLRPSPFVFIVWLRILYYHDYIDNNLLYQFLYYFHHIDCDNAIFMIVYAYTQS